MSLQGKVSRKRIKNGAKSYRVGAHLPFAERALTKPTTQRVAETQRTKWAQPYSKYKDWALHLPSCVSRIVRFVQQARKHYKGKEKH